MNNMSFFKEVLVTNSDVREPDKLKWKKFMQDFMFWELENEAVQHQCISFDDFEDLMTSTTPYRIMQVYQRHYLSSRIAVWPYITPRLIKNQLGWQKDHSRDACTLHNA